MVERVTRLVVEEIVNLAEEPEVQSLFPPDCCASFGSDLHELPSLQGQAHRLARHLGEIEHLGRLTTESTRANSRLNSSAIWKASALSSWVAKYSIRATTSPAKTSRSGSTNRAAEPASLPDGVSGRDGVRIR